MNEIKTTITEQLQQLQILMHRASFHSFMGDVRMHNPHRGQGRVLSILKMKPEISQKELTYLLNMSKQSLAELLAKLEKSGYITREPSEEDKRVLTVKLTEEGMNAAIDAGDETSETTKVLDCLNEEELDKFSEYLDRIISRYEEQFPEEDFQERRRMMEEFMSQYGRGRGHGHEFDSFGGHGRPPGRHDRF
jgi:DNA-binding MarR family transcriptional regulator